MNDDHDHEHDNVPEGRSSIKKGRGVGQQQQQMRLPGLTAEVDDYVPSDYSDSQVSEDYRFHDEDDDEREETAYLAKVGNESEPAPPTTALSGTGSAGFENSAVAASYEGMFANENTTRALSPNRRFHHMRPQKKKEVVIEDDGEKEEKKVEVV